MRKTLQSHFPVTMPVKLSARPYINAALVAALALGSVACSSSDDGVVYSSGPASRAIVATRTSNHSAGQFERISITLGDAYDGSFSATGSDIAVAADATHLYEIGKSNLDSITKRSPDDPATLVYQRSIAGDDTFANPYEIVFEDVTRAYIIRYGSDKVWIVDPSSATEEDFKTGELDLSAYNDTIDDVSTPPGASDGLLIGNKLFVMMERLESFVPVKQGYIAVFNTETGEEIDTGMGGADGLKGIPLGIFNPIALQQPDTGGLLYAVGRGHSFGEEAEGVNRYTGGIVSINPETYDVITVLDDGDEMVNEGFFDNALVVDDTSAYVVTQAGFGNNTLRKLALSTGELAAAPVADITGLPITTLAKGPKNRLWVGLQRSIPGFKLLNLEDDSVARETVPTALIPINVVFIDTTTPEP